MIGLGFKTPDKKIKEMLKDLRDSPAKFEKAMRYAIIDTAQRMKQEELQEMLFVFDRPRKYTTNALFVKYPKPGLQQFGGIAFKERGSQGGKGRVGSTEAHKYLMPQVKGGRRRMKSHELQLQQAGILPSGKFAAQGKNYPRDDSGNITGGRYRKMLSQISKLSEQARKMKNSGEIAAIAERNGQFYLVPKGRGKSGSNRKRPGQIMVAFITSPTYRKRFQFHEVAQESGQREFQKQLERQWVRYQPIGGWASSPGFQFKKG